MNSTYNPLLKATRAAFTELTTPEAWRWYAQQLQTGVALAQTVTIKSITTARRLLSSRNTATIAAAEPVQTQTDSECGDRVTTETTTSVEPTALSKAPASLQPDVLAQGIEHIEDGTVLDLFGSPNSDIHIGPFSTLHHDLASVTEPAAEATDLEPEPASTAWTATDEIGGAADDGPLIEVEASEEDTSFYEPEDEDAIDGLTHEPEDAAQPQEPCFDTAQQPCFGTAQQPSRLSLLIQEFKRQKAESSAERVGEDGSIHVAHASTASAGAAAFAWEDAPAEGDSEAELGHGEDSLELIKADQVIDLFPTPATETADSRIQVGRS